MSTRDHIRGLRWPAKLAAHVVEGRARPRIHGIDVHHDLVPHYGFAESLLLALRGEPPSADEGRAFETALLFAMPTDVGQAPAHAASVARVCGASSSSTLGIAALALAEQASRIVAAHQTWLDGLGREGVEPGPPPRRADPQEGDAIEALRGALPEGIRPSLPPDCPSLEAAILAVFFVCGLRSAPQLETALVVSRLAVVQAEALHHRPGRLNSYPMNLPPFRYLADDE